MKPSKYRNIADARTAARRRLPRVLFDFVDGGADGEVTLRDNAAAYSELNLVPKAAAFPDQPVAAKKVLGTELAMPLILSPCGGIRLLYPDGDRAVVRAATSAGIVSVMSTASRTPPEDVIEQAGRPLWFQLYFHGQREEAEVLVDRVQDAGFGALFVTVDSSGMTNLERLARHSAAFPIEKSVSHALHFAPQFATHPGWFARFFLDGMPTTYSSLPEGKTIKSGAPAPAVHGSALKKAASHPCPTWADIDWIRQQWRGPLVVKGVLTADDARLAVDHGADGIVISNHGGRQLDCASGTLRMLPEIKSAVGSQLEILIDGGIRRGGDVIKAIALGADAAMIGRPYLYGLSAAGEAGVDRVIDIFRRDIVRVLAQTGCATIDEVDASIIRDSRHFSWQV